MATSSVPLPTKLAYGAGTISDGVKNTSFNTFLLFFYTQVVGLSGARAGTVILLALVVDAITDPLVGHISDHFRSRWGRRHPFMYAAAIPMGLCFVFLFHPPDGFSQNELFVWMLVFAIGVRLSMTFYSVPSGSLVAEMTDNYDERTGIVGYRILSGWIGGLVAAQIGYLIFFAPSEAFPDGRLNAEAYGGYALVCAAIIIGAIWTCAIGTHWMIPQLHKPAEDHRFSIAGFFKELVQVFSNKAYLVLVVTILMAAAATGFTDVMNLYVNTYFWEFTTAQIAILVYAAIIGTVLGFSLTPVVSRKTDKRTLALINMSVIVFIGPLPVILRLAGLMPENGSDLLLGIIMVYTTLIVYVAVSIMIVAGSMIADTIDQNELDYGVRQEGMFNAAFALTSKATSGIGGFVGGIAIEVIEFPTGALPGEVPAETVTALGWAVGPAIMGFWLIALAVLSLYPLTREKHQAIIQALKERQSGAA